MSFPPDIGAEDTKPGVHKFALSEGVILYERGVYAHQVAVRHEYHGGAHDYDWTNATQPIEILPVTMLDGERWDLPVGKGKVRFYVYAATERDRVGVSYCVARVIHRLTVHIVDAKLTKNERRRLAHGRHPGRRGALRVKPTKKVPVMDWYTVNQILTGCAPMWEDIARQVKAQWPSGRR